MAQTTSNFTAGNVFAKKSISGIKNRLADNTFLNEAIKNIFESGALGIPLTMPGGIKAPDTGAPSAPAPTAPTGGAASAGASPTLVILPLPQPVAPGNLITSDFMNALIAKLSELDARMLALESEPSAIGTLVITGLSPSGSVRVQDEMRIFGRNFGISDGTLRARLVAESRSVDITAYKTGSSDSLLIFNIPDIPNLAATGEQLNLSMRNATSGDSRQITVLPVAMVPSGRLNIDFISVSPNTIKQSALAEFRFNLVSRSNVAAVYSLEAEITGVQNSAAWQSQVEFTDESGTVIRSVSLAPNQVKPLIMRIKSVPGVNGTTFNVKLNAYFGAGSSQVSGTSGELQFTVGGTVKDQDDSISLSVTKVNFVQGDGSVDAGKIIFKKGSAAVITLQATMSIAGEYNFTTALADALNWRVAPLNDKATTFTINEEDLSPEKNVNSTIQFAIQPLDGASSGGRVLFTLKRTGAESEFTFPVELQLKA